jgi:hypothetical protein
MLDRLRLPFFLVAVALLVICVLVELGAPQLMTETPGGEGRMGPGLGIPYLAIVDGLLLFTIGLIVAPMLISHRVHGRVQGIATLLFSLLLLLGAIALVFVAIGLLMLMLSLLMAVPFGTAVYLAGFADFPYGQAATVLSLVMALKLGFAVCLVLAHQRFLENRGLVLLILTSIGLTLLLGFLLNFPPGFLRSITDSISAIVTGIVGAVWALVYLVGAIPAIVKALRVDRAIG